jgi:alpha-galactosidase
MDRLVYLLTGGFLGRLCVSGEISSLDPEQWALVKEGIQFYQQVAPLIARGKSRLFQSISPSWQHLQGAQAVLRLAEDEQSAIVVTHSFASPWPPELRVPLPGSVPGKGWQVARCFPQSGPAPEIMDGQLHFVPSKEWQGAGIYLTR